MGASATFSNCINFLTMSRPLGTKGQNRGEPVPDTATLTRVGHRAQGFQQPLRRHGSHGSEASGVANGRGDQRRYTSGHGDGSRDRYGCREPLMITGRAVSRGPDMVCVGPAALTV